MQLIGSRDQMAPDFSLRGDVTITTGGASQLLLPITASRSRLEIQNTSSGVLWFEFGSARATATISGGSVTGCTITNGGKGFTAPPRIHFWGGAGPGQALGAKVGAGMPGYAVPNNAGGTTANRPAQAHCVLTSGVVTSIVIDDPGAGYAFAPFLFLKNDETDNYGGADPYYNSATSGMQLQAGGSYVVNGTACDIDQIYVYGATTGQSIFLKWMP